MSKHTPGPWHVGSHSVTAILDGTGGLIATAEDLAIHFTNQDYDERDANARLIAAAPDLLAELENIVNIDMVKMREDFGTDAEHQFRLWAQNRARAAIQKATEKGGGL